MLAAFATGCPHPSRKQQGFFLLGGLLRCVQQLCPQSRRRSQGRRQGFCDGGFRSSDEVLLMTRTMVPARHSLHSRWGPVLSPGLCVGGRTASFQTPRARHAYEPYVREGKTEDQPGSGTGPRSQSREGQPFTGQLQRSPTPASCRVLGSSGRNLPSQRVRARPPRFPRAQAWSRRAGPTEMP